MGLRSVEDILRHGFNGTKPRLLQISYFSCVVLRGNDTFSSLDLVSKHNMAWKKSGPHQSFYADVHNSFSALFDRSPLDSLEFLHSPSSNSSQNLRSSQQKATQSQKQDKRTNLAFFTQSNENPLGLKKFGDSPPPTSKKKKKKNLPWKVCNRIWSSNAPPPFPQAPPLFGCGKTKRSILLHLSEGPNNWFPSALSVHGKLYEHVLCARVAAQCLDCSFFVGLWYAHGGGRNWATKNLPSHPPSARMYLMAGLKTFSLSQTWRDPSNPTLPPEDIRGWEYVTRSTQMSAER